MPAVVGRSSLTQPRTKATKKKKNIQTPLMGLEPTTFELEVQRASIAPQGWVTYLAGYSYVHTISVAGQRKILRSSASCGGGGSWMDLVQHHQVHAVHQDRA